ncbi:MAG: S1 family peptidase [Waterburya sp.]
MNKWINQKFISAIISGIVTTTIATVGINYQKAIALPASTINQIVKNSAVRIDGTENGSGVIFAQDDYGYVVLTNGHVVENAGKYQVITADGKSHAVSDIQILEATDLALIYFDTQESYSVISQGNSDALVEGQLIHIAGYPGTQNVASNRTYRFMSESLIGFLAPSDIKDGYELIYSGEAVPGMSGSPIVNEEAQLIGVYGLTDIDFTTGASYLYGIPINTVLKTATRLGIELKFAETPANQPSGLIDLFAPPPGTDLGTNSVISNDQNGNVGFEIIGNGSINNFVIPEIIYTGECPGKELESQAAMFFSNTTSTAPNRRVIITNVTRGLDRNPLPYTDREYQEGQISEETEVTLGVEHDEENFVLLAGQNQFNYEIVQIEEDDDLETVLEEGTFMATAQKESRYVERKKEPVEETYCPNNDKYCDSKEQKVRIVDKCPVEKRGLFGL